MALVEQYLDLEHQEKRTFKRVESVLQNIPIYTQYLTHIKGIGPAMAGVIVSEIDIHEASNISKLWKYAGLDVVINPETGTKVRSWLENEASFGEVLARLHESEGS